MTLPSILRDLEAAGIAVPEVVSDRIDITEFVKRNHDPHQFAYSEAEEEQRALAALARLLLERDAAAKKAEWQRDEAARRLEGDRGWYDVAGYLDELYEERSRPK